MFKSSTTTTTTTTAPAPPPKPLRRDWYVQEWPNAAYMCLLLIYEPTMKHNDKILVKDCVEFAKVVHTDPDFEQKWATAIRKGRRRITILNQGLDFADQVPDTAPICGNCSQEFDGDDYLCNNCRAENNLPT